MIGMLSVSRRGRRLIDRGFSLARSVFDPLVAARRRRCRAARRRLSDRAPRIAPTSPTIPSRDVAIAADRRVAHVDLDDRLRAQALAVAETEVERRADDDDHVGFAERVATRELEAQRMIGRQRSAPGTVHVRRNVEVSRRTSPPRSVQRGRSRPADRAESPGASRDQNVGQFFDVGRIADALGRGARAARRLRDHGFRRGRPSVEDVTRNFEVRRTERAVE